MISDINLTASMSLIASKIVGVVATGLSPQQSSQQSFAVSYGYTFGSAAGGVSSTLDEIILIPLILAGGASRTINLVTGAETDPTSFSPARLGTLKELFAWVPLVNVDDQSPTPVLGITIAMNGSMSNCCGYAAIAPVKTMIPGQRWCEGTPAGRSTGADASMVITNSDPTGKTTVMIGFAGFKP